VALSKKHHYIPKFYLKGFSDEKGQYFVYDKVADRLWKTSPENSFAENYRNTGRYHNSETNEYFTTDVPEQMLAYFDGRAAVVIHDIRNSKPTDPVLSSDRLYVLRFFIFSIFWRTPANDKIRNEIIANSSFESLGFGIFDKNTGIRNIEAENKIKEADVFQKVYPTLLPITSFSDKYVKLNNEQWKIYYLQEDFHIVTDNPIIHWGYQGFASLHEELLFPISSKVMLVSTKKYKPHILPPVFSLNLDLLLFHKANRYVACNRKDYLEFLIAQSKENLSRPGWAEKLQNQIFGCFY
jgi:hypothetical protein